MTKMPASRLIACAALLALVVSSLAPVTASAEEFLPPAEPTAEASLLPEAASPTAVPTLDGEATPVPGESPPGEAEVAPSQEPVPAGEPAAEPDLAAAIEAAPEGTTVAVVGGDGTLLPLATDAAADTVAAADPIWCPASVKAPTPNLNGCTGWFASMTALVGWLSDDVNEPAMDGVIWIEQGHHADGSAITLDGDLGGNDGFAIMSLYKLTLRGGWSGNPGDKTITPDNPSDFNVRLQVVDWANDVTLSDIVVENAPAGDALVVTTSGNINITRVQSSNNTGRGARLDASAAGKKVTLTDCEFNGNDGAGGLYVLAKGPITLTNVIAGYYDEGTDTSYGNTGGYGAYLSNNTVLAAGAGITLAGVNTFSANASYGLSVTSRGAINANDLTASGNGTSGSGSGAELDNGASPSAAGVTLTGTSLFAGNETSGLYIESSGPIKLNNLNAHSNHDGYGAEINNTYNPVPQPVTLTGSNSFKYNWLGGVLISSYGAIALNNLTANGSGNGRGAWINNNIGTSVAPISFTGSSTFNDNYLEGLLAFSFGEIKASNLTATGNALISHSGGGIYLDNHDALSPVGITLTGKTIASGNHGDGLFIESAGKITVQSVTASDNVNGAGALVSNLVDPAAPQKVTLSGPSTFSRNHGMGLYITSYGAISLGNLTASDNGSSGSSGGVSLINSGADTPQKVTLTGTNVFSDNYSSGLAINSRGAIAVSNLTSTGNGLIANATGVSLVNSSALSAQPVTLTGKTVISGNGSDGLNVSTVGSVSLASLTAEDNLGFGAYIDNASAATPQKVTLSGTHLFRDNASSGLSISSLGAITLSSAVATGNALISGAGSGIEVSNAGATSPQPVTLTGSFTLDGNDDNGLFVAASGIVKASNLTARSNAGRGVTITNTSLATASGVTLSGTNRIESNAFAGMVLSTHGPVSIANLTASGNGLLGHSGVGAEIANQFAASPQKVTLTGTNVFNGNYSSGLEVTSLGAITVSNLSASDNGQSGVWGYGAFLDNEEPAAVGGVTLSGSSAFLRNGITGLDISSRGAISLNTTRLEASGNGAGPWGGGATLVNNLSTLATPPGVTLKGSSLFNENRDTGLIVQSLGAITASNLTASGNGTDGNGNGAYLDNDDNPLYAGSVTLSGTNLFNANAENGFWASSRGAITLSSITASDNGQGGGWGYGLLLNNAPPSGTVKPVKLTGYGIFLDNFSRGIDITSLGAISAVQLNASGNHDAGASFSNVGPAAVGGLTLSGTNVFNDNVSSGLLVSSLGAITISNLTASGNGGTGFGDGVRIDNASAGSPQPVKLTGYGAFHDNHNTGLLIYSDGAISAANLAARGNFAGGGAIIDNGSGMGGVTLAGTNAFTGNGSTGLLINTSGAISLTKVTADNNLDTGLSISDAAALTLTCGSFVGNDIFGFYFGNSLVTPLLIGVFASGNTSGQLRWAGHGEITSTVRACPSP